MAAGRSDLTGAVSQSEQFLAEAADAVREVFAGERTERRGSGGADPPGQPEPGKRVPPADVQVPSGRAAFEGAVVRGPLPDNPLCLGELGLQVRPGRLEPDSSGEGQHLAQAFANTGTAVEVAPHPLAQIDALADVEGCPRLVDEFVDAGRGRQIGHPGRDRALPFGALRRCGQIDG